MPSEPPESGYHPQEPGRARGRHGALPPPAARPLSPELIADLHARCQWFAEASSSSHPLLYNYLRYNWHDREAQTWAAAQIHPGAALAWRELGLTPPEAAELQKAGQQPENVRTLWHRSGVPIEEIGNWLGAGLTPEEALEQRALGVTAEDAAVMRGLRSIDRR
jgi:hypothetical protein